MPETSGTWTGANHIAVAVYRGARAPIAASNNGIRASSDNSANINYNALAPATYPASLGTGWYVGFASHKTATNVETAPTGMGNRASGGTEVAVHDTGAPVSTNWSATTVTVNATNVWVSFVVQVPALTTVSRVGVGAGDGNSIAIPAGHQVGDLILIFTSNDIAGTAITTPAGYTDLLTRSSAGIAGTCSYRIATVADTAPFTPTISVY